MHFNHRYLWDPRFLKSKLAINAISERSSFVYFFAITGFDWLQFSIIRLSTTPGEIHEWEYLETLSSLLITVLGLIFLFSCNGGSHGKDFLYRYFPLSFIVGWKFMVSMSVAIWLTGLVMQNEPDYVVGWTSTVILAVFNVAMFLRIGFHLRALARVKSV